jgi:NADH-quinone oxidoreductase subunit J
MAIFFYLFATIVVFSSLMVISVRNPVHGVLWLILTFCNAAGLMVLMGAEFLAMMLIIIYVGAVAVLFLFVVMMLDIKNAELKGIIGAEMGLAAIIALFLFIDLVAIILLNSGAVVPALSHANFAISPDIGNSYIIGRLLYTDFILPFQTAGVILFAAMIASIVLTMRLRSGVKRQRPSEQLLKNKDNSMVMAKNTGKFGLGNLNYDD